MMQHPLLDDADYCNNFGSCGSCDGDGFCAGEEERGSQQKGNAGRYDGDRLERSTAAEGLAGRGRRLERRRASLASSEGAETKSEAGTASSASTATCQLRRHMVKNGDTLEGICINYGCSVADLKRLNNLLWHSDSIHLRKVLVIPDKMQASRSFVHANPSHFLRLKHDLSAHPSNFNLFVDSEAGRTKMTLKSDLEPDGTSTTGTSITSAQLKVQKGIEQQMRNQEALEENERVMESLRDLDADVESICACWVRPAPDTPVSVNPVYVVERGTLIVRLFYAQTDSGEMLNMLFDAGCTPCGNERNPDMSGIGARWPSYVPYQHPFLVSHSVILSPSSCGFIPLARGDWRVVVEVKDRCARVLGDRVRKVVETDVAGRIHRLIVGEFC